MTPELDMALRWFTGGVFVGIVSVWWIRAAIARLPNLLSMLLRLIWRAIKWRSIGLAWWAWQYESRDKRG